MAAQPRHVTWHEGDVTREERERLLGQRGSVVWLTGLSGSGKSTIAAALERELLTRGRASCRLDGDNLRHGLNADLGFSPADREENIRRACEVAALLADAGLIVLAAFVSPYAADREAARRTVGAERFVEVHCNTPLAVCEARDPKGLYRKARAGEVTEFTGVTAPYQAPAAPDVRLAAGTESVAACAAAVLDHLERRGLIPPASAPDTTKPPTGPADS